jgi:hypothetical protein
MVEVEEDLGPFAGVALVGAIDGDGDVDFAVAGADLGDLGVDAEVAEPLGDEAHEPGAGGWGLGEELDLAADEGADEAFEHGDRSRWMRLFLYGIGFGGGFGWGFHPDLGGDTEIFRILIGQWRRVLELERRYSEAHIVYCDSQMLLDRNEYGSWRNVQDAYEDYNASFGPWSEAEIVEFLEDDWGLDDLQWPFTRRAIVEFFRSSDLLLVCQEAELGG